MNKRKFNEQFSAYKKSKKNIIHLEATNKIETIHLNEAKTSWIKLIKLEEPDGLSLAEFEKLWTLKPVEKLKIKIAGKIIECPRYSKSFLQPYKFSGLNHAADLNLPKRIETLLNDYAKKINPDLNQSLIN